MVEYGTTRVAGGQLPLPGTTVGGRRDARFDASRINKAAFAYYPPLRRVKEQLDRDPSQAMPLRAAADIAGLEAKYFSAFFRAKTGVCFSEWLCHRRIESAKALFRSSERSVTHVAFAVGFQDLTTFERAFKKLNGKTPRAFRREVRPGS